MVILGLSVLLAATCTQPDTPAIVRAVPLEPPSIVAAADEHGTAQLIVTLTPTSSQPADVTLSRTSGSMMIDAAAIQVARETQFVPETQACTPVGGQYFLEVEI